MIDNVYVTVTTENGKLENFSVTPAVYDVTLGRYTQVFARGEDIVNTQIGTFKIKDKNDIQSNKKTLTYFAKIEI